MDFLKLSKTIDRNTENKVNEKMKSNLHNIPFNDSNVSKHNNIVQRVLDTRDSAQKNSRILAPQQINDKYKHAYLSCKEAQKGNVEATTIAVGGLYKEYLDQKRRTNTLSESWNDIKADAYGIYQGRKYPKGDCDALVQKKYKKRLF